MAIRVIINDIARVVTSGGVNYVAREIDSGRMNIAQAKNYLVEECILKDTPCNPKLGAIDFDNLNKYSKPTVIGDFYGTNTEAGLRFNNKWEKGLQKMLGKGPTQTKVIF